MKKNTLYIIIALLVLINIGQFVYFYAVISDFKSELKITRNNNGSNGSGVVRDSDYYRNKR